MFTTPLDIWTLRESQKKGGLQPRGDTGSEEKVKNLQTCFHFYILVQGKRCYPGQEQIIITKPPGELPSYQFPYNCVAFSFPRLTSQISVLISLLVSSLLTVLSFYPSAAKVKEPGNGSSCELASLFIILCTLKHLHGILYQVEKLLNLFSLGEPASKAAA